MIPLPFRPNLQRAARASALVVLASLGAGPTLCADKPAKAAPKPQTEEEVRATLEGKSPQERITILTEIVDAGQADKNVYFQLGNAHYEKGEPGPAAKSFEKAVAMDSTFFKAAVNLALMYDEQQQFAKALETFERAAALQPDNPEVWSHMGNTYYAQRNYAKAMELYRKALQLQPTAAHALYSLGVAFADAGIFREAVRHWKRVAELEPTSELGKNASENVQLLQKYLIP